MTQRHSTPTPACGEQRKTRHPGADTPVAAVSVPSLAEVADLPCGAADQDPKNPDGDHLPVPSTAWDAFLTAARS
ncbi:DUF397 domain-containing protein [Nocardiopsis sp. YSL2]|uniref:DUF397 domain-containing protein n=1 Tax=Nocardiopsis sp. YSL2 TaxID=2939492 RepID=UPI0026F461DE|nr:DUF397 domain-containing protein [Nocardiopsis sp. YSL2]